MRPVGYLICYPGDLQGERGSHYDYVTACNGLFVEAVGDLLTARVPIAPVRLRGLAELEPSVILRHGKIPSYLFDLALNVMMTDAAKERYVAINWAPIQKHYSVYIPQQDRQPAHIAYDLKDNLFPIVMDLHSHGRMKPFFSGEDNRDEQGFRIYGVVGNLDRDPRLLVRIGVYGYYFPLVAADVFEGIVSIRGETNELET